jgi:DUF1009 family protein
MIVISGWGAYPRLIVEGAHAAGVRQVDVLAVRGSTDRATVKAADNVHVINIGGIAAGLRWVAAQGYAGACFAGQINPLSLFTARFDEETKGWLNSLPVKNAHTVYGKLAYEFEAAGVKVFPASSFMDGHLPGVGALTVRSLTDREAQIAAAVLREIRARLDFLGTTFPRPPGERLQ